MGVPARLQLGAQGRGGGGADAVGVACRAPRPSHSHTVCLVNTQQPVRHTEQRLEVQVFRIFVSFAQYGACRDSPGDFRSV